MAIKCIGAQRSKFGGIKTWYFSDGTSCANDLSGVIRYEHPTTQNGRHQEELIVFRNGVVMTITEKHINNDGTMTYTSYDNVADDGTFFKQTHTTKVNYKSFNN